MALQKCAGDPACLLRAAHRRVDKAIDSLLGSSECAGDVGSDAQNYEKDTIIFALELACREKINESHPQMGPNRGETPMSFKGGNAHLRMNLQKRVEQIRAAELAARETGIYQIKYHPTDPRHPDQQAKRKLRQQQEREAGKARKKTVTAKYWPMEEEVNRGEDGAQSQAASSS